VFPSGTHKVPKLRVFLDFLVERFGGEPARRAPRGSGDRRDAAEAERSRG
jgi:hypothetical protein